MDLKSIKGLKAFKLYSYAYNAMKHWMAAVMMRELDLHDNAAVIIESYEMAIEQFLKYIVARTEGISREHIHTHNLWRLACDIELQRREKYRKLLQRLGLYYSEFRYELDNPEDRLRIEQYFTLDDTLEEMDQLLYFLYTSAQELDTASAHRQKDKSAEEFRRVQSEIKADSDSSEDAVPDKSKGNLSKMNLF